MATRIRKRRSWLPCQGAWSGAAECSGSIPILLLFPLSCLLVLCLRGDQELTLRTSVHVVAVSIVATDSAGAPAEGLGVHDFRVWDNGKAQTIASFEKISSEEAPAPAVLPPDTYSNRMGEAAAGGLGKTGRPQTLSMILLDSVNTKYRHQTVSRLAVEKVLDELPPGQRVAIYAFGSHLRILHDFSSDKTSLLAAVRAYHGEIPIRNDFIRDLEYDDPGIPLITPQTLACKPRTQPETPLELAALKGRILDSLEALEAIANHVKGIPGRKNLLWVSAAFPVMVGQLALAGPIVAPSMGSNRPSPFADNKNYGDGMGRAGAALNDASVSVYPIDPRGISCNPDVAINIDTMKDIADATGGKAFYNRNDLTTGVRSALDDARVAYELTYSPHPTAQDGAYHTIRVQCARRGVQLHYRRGYFAPGMKETGDAAADRLTAVLSSPLDASGIGIQASLGQASGNDVSVAIRVDAADLNLTRKAAKWTGALHLEAMQTGAAGERLGGVSQTAELNLEPATYQRALRQGLPFEMKLPRDPAAVAVRIGAVDERGGHAGSLTVPLPPQR